MTYFPTGGEKNQILKPTTRQNIHTPTRLKQVITNGTNSADQDLDLLAQQLNVSPINKPISSVTSLKSKFGSPSATVSSFKLTPKSSTSSNTSNKEQGVAVGDETPTWARKNYKELLNKSPVRSTPKLQQQSPGFDFGSRKAGYTSPSNNSSKSSPGYEYLCRVEAIRQWLEEVLCEQISQSPVELISYIRNGIYLAKLANVILPTQRNVFSDDKKLQFRHTENINRFFHLLDFLNVPDLFRFELTDLYDAKNVPKVWFCLHALSYILNKSDHRYPKMNDLMKKIEFEGDDIIAANKALLTAPLPNFTSADSGNTSEDSRYMNNMLSPAKAKLEKLSPNPFIEEKKPDLTPPAMFEIKTPAPTFETKQQKPSQSTFQSTKSDRLNHDGLEENYVHIIKLQSLARGANFRYSMFVDKIMLKSYEDDIVRLCSIIRGNLSRSKTIHRHRDELRAFSYEIVELQSLIRRKIATANRFQLQDGEMNHFQSIIRGKVVRERVEATKYAFSTMQSSITQLQSLIKMRFVYSRVKVLVLYKDEILPPITELQALCRSKLYKKFSSSRSVDSPIIIELQSLIRRDAVIHEINRKHMIVRSAKKKLVELQSIARAGVARSRLCNNVLITLINEDDTLSNLSAFYRGEKVRSSIQRTKAELNMLEHSSIIPVQTLFRGVLGRFNYEIILDELYEHVGSVMALQAKIRANTVKHKFNNIVHYYELRIESVIKAQAMIRKCLAQYAYKSLITSPNPSLVVLRQFAHLLSNSDGDFEQEVQLSRVKDLLIEKSKNNEKLEGQIESIDLKLSLLHKNKITVEEFTKFKGPNERRVQTNEIPTNLNILSKAARAKVELYSTLFYHLQTKSKYLANVYKAKDYVLKSSESYQTLLANTFQLFPIIEPSISRHTREEYYYMKLVLVIMQNDIAKSQTVTDITKSQFTHWTEFVTHFNNLTYQRQHLKLLAGKFVHKILDYDELDFESDPTIIHSQVVPREHTVKSEVSPQDAIKVPEVSSRFVSNLMGLREYCSEVMKLIESNISRTPVHMRLICREAYQLARSLFPAQSDQQHLAVAGVCFWKYYFGVIISFPENYGINSRNYLKGQGNLRHLHRVMLQLFSMRPFTNNFLKPLNDYLESSVDSIQSIVRGIIDIEDIDEVYKCGNINDMVAEAPKLTMKTNSMIFLEKVTLSSIDVMSGSTDDPLLKVAQKLESLTTSSTDLVAMTDLSSITIILNRNVHDESLADSKTKVLFTQAKRCMLYIMRVQGGDDLLELLISGIKASHEQKFREIVASEKEDSMSTTKMYYKTSLGDLDKMSYHDLKRMCLESLLKLEAMGEVTRKNSFQELLNQIAIDIKSKNIQRKRRVQQLEVSDQTVKKLSEKERFLRQQLNEYNRHVESILADSQLKPKDKKIFSIIPVFSKQYFYNRELRKRNRLPEFGSYKLSAKKLKDQKILLKTSSSLIDSSKMDFTFSCYQVGKFTVEASKNLVVVGGASSVITLDDLLALQYEQKKTFTLFDDNATFDANNFIAFIFKKFYDVKGE
ncbi:IQG1 [Candida margitis]|uniref:IQG1 n=1 Tax=Candida margitis TaxID=1775924 RepID=UPI0022277F47|nr:IQG1 [Candida margitis]KAI5959121.1 IQG1 [Candida margitis]